MRWWPISAADQLLFAEAFSQALAAGIDVSEAAVLAATVNPSPRFREALLEMTRSCRSGHCLEESLVKTGVRVKEGLLAALQVGEDQGSLGAELAAFARQLDPRAEARLLRTIGRSAEAIRFAGALARLLGDHRMTLEIVADAGRIAAGGNRSFRVAVEQMVEEMRNGESFPGVLERQPRWFDRLYCRSIRAATGREGMRSALKRLAGDPIVV